MFNQLGYYDKQQVWYFIRNNSTLLNFKQGITTTLFSYIVGG